MQGDEKLSFNTCGESRLVERTELALGVGRLTTFVPTAKERTCDRCETKPNETPGPPFSARYTKCGLGERLTSHHGVATATSCNAHRFALQLNDFVARDAWRYNDRERVDRLYGDGQDALRGHSDCARPGLVLEKLFRVRFRPRNRSLSKYVLPTSSRPNISLSDPDFVIEGVLVFRAFDFQ